MPLQRHPHIQTRNIRIQQRQDHLYLRAQGTNLQGAHKHRGSLHAGAPFMMPQQLGMHTSIFTRQVWSRHTTAPFSENTLTCTTSTRPQTSGRKTGREQQTAVQPLTQRSRPRRAEPGSKPRPAPPEASPSPAEARPSEPAAPSEPSSSKPSSSGHDAVSRQKSTPPLCPSASTRYLCTR